MTDAVRVAKDRDVATLVFDGLDELIGSAWDHQIDVIV